MKVRVCNPQAETFADCLPATDCTRWLLQSSPCETGCIMFWEMLKGRKGKASHVEEGEDEV